MVKFMELPEVEATIMHKEGMVYMVRKLLKEYENYGLIGSLNIINIIMQNPTRQKI